MSNSQIVFLISLKKIMRFVRTSKKVGRILVSTLAILLLCASLAESHGDGCEDNGYLISHSQSPPANVLSIYTWSRQWGGDQDGEPITETAHHRHYMTKDGEEPRWRFWNVFKRNWDSDTFCPQPPPPTTPSPTNQNPSSESETTQSRPAIVRNYDCDTVSVGADEECYDWDFNVTHRVGVPVLPEGVETVADLWDHIRSRTRKRVSIQSLHDGLWRTYEGEPNEWGDVELTPHIGLVIYYTPPFVFGIKGTPVQGQEIELVVPDGESFAVHAIGFPEPPANYERFSDLVVDGVDWVRRRVRVDGSLRYLYITSASDEGDKEIEPGDSVTIRIRKTVTYDLRGAVMRAPQAHRQHTLTTSWGTMKGVHRP